MDREMSSVEESVIGGYHQLMEMMDNRHGRSIGLFHPAPPSFPDNQLPEGGTAS